MELTPSLSVGTSLLRSARRLSRFTLLLAGLIPLFVLAQYLLVDAASIPAPFGMTALLTGLDWTLERRLLAALVGLLPAAAIAYALVALSRICHQYAEGRLFSDVVLGGYRRLGVALVVTTVLSWLQPTLFGLALTLPPGKRFLTVGISSNDLLLILLTALVFLLGAVMQVAQRVQSENAEIV